MDKEAKTDSNPPKKTVKLDPNVRRGTFLAVTRKNTDKSEVVDWSNLPANVYGRPVEEVDPFVFDDTFCIISKKYGKHYIYRFSASRSLFIFGPLNPIRKIAARIIANQLFDLFIIIVILCNCITLALVTNYEVGNSGKMQKNPKFEKNMEIIENIYLGIYSIEMILKIIVKGFIINKFSYLRNRWNILDCVVVLSGFVTMIVTNLGHDINFDIDILRTFRVLRAIKTISILPGLRMMINALLSSATQLVEVMALTLFCLMIFSLLALELYNGKLKQKCVIIKNGSWHQHIVEKGDRNDNELASIDPNDPDVHMLWYNWTRNEQNWKRRAEDYPMDEFMPCGNNSYSRSCGNKGYVCLPNLGENFDEGWTSFDNFHSSMLSTFQLITLDFWERLYELILSTTEPVHVFFFLIVIFLGSFCLLNLMLAVVAMSYQAEVERAETRNIETKNQKLSLHRTASNFSFDEPRKLNVNIMTEYRKRTPSQREMLARTLRVPSIKPEETTEGKEKPNLQTAIMTLIGRRTSVHRNKVAPESPTVPVADPNSVPVDATQSLVVPISNVTYGTDRKTEEELLKKGGVEEIESKSTFYEEPVEKKYNCCKRGCLKFLNCVRRALTPIVEHGAFETAITISIIINTTLMASEHHGQPKWLDSLLKNGNYFFTGVFVLEALLKICALQVDYFKSGWNIFDLVIVLMSLADSVQESYDIGISVIRALRLLRVFKLAQSWLTMKVLLNIIMSTFGDLVNLIVVLLIVLYIFAVLGLQYLGEYYTRAAFKAEEDDRQFPRWNFQDFWYAFMLVFRVICGEWIEPLWDCLKAMKTVNSEYKCFVIFLPILVVGNFIVLNLFLALLLNSFGAEELKARQQKELEIIGKSDELKKLVNLLIVRGGENKGKSGMSSGETSSLSTMSANAEDGGGGGTVAVAGGDSGEKIRERRRKKKLKPLAQFRRLAKKQINLNRHEVAVKMIEKTLAKQKQAPTVKNIAPKKVYSKSSRHSSVGIGATDSTSMTINFEKGPNDCFPKKISSLNCACLNCCKRVNWTGWYTAREKVNRIVSHPIFEWFILALIFCSSITLCLDDIYLEFNPQLEQILFYLNMCFTILFVIEMLLKWFAHGLWTYFTTFWTILDFFIVTISLILLSFDIQGRQAGGGESSRAKKFAALKALRTLRALRPLRLISRWQGMKIVINALMYAIPSIFNVLLVCLLFWLIFSIMGVQFFKGKFYKCVDNKKGDILSHHIVSTKEECCNNTNKWSWINQQPNFDSVFQGYLTLFQVATFEGWMEAMRASVDSTEVDHQPKRDASRVYYLYYVVFIVFGAFFTLNLFIGVIIDNFNRLKKQYEGNLIEALLTPSQRNYYKLMKRLGKKKPRKVIKRPSTPILSIFYDVSMSRKFEIAVFCMIFLNLLVMGFEQHNLRALYVHILSAFNSFFITIYALEAVVKIIGLRQYYFTVPWNIFDLLIIITSCVDLFVGEHSIFQFQKLRIIRIFRIGRVLRLIKAAKNIRKLLFALIVSVPALFNIGALLALITFIYAILGMALFGRIAKDNAIDEMFNFETFLRSCLFLLRIMTAAGWNDVLSAMLPEIPVCGTFRKIKCGLEGEPECANVGLAVAYMVSYLIISYLIVINMYIAIILENFVEASREEEVGIMEDDLDSFYVRWSRYDPLASQFISFDQLSDFMDSLDPPLGVKKPNILAIVAFNLPIYRGNKIHCVDILHRLVKRALGSVEDSPEFFTLQDQIEHKFRKQFPNRKILDVISTTMEWKKQHHAAIVIQRAWRAYCARKYPALERMKKGVRGSGSGTTSLNSRQKDHHGMLRKMGNLLIVGHYHHDRHKRRDALKGDDLAQVKAAEAAIKKNSSYRSRF